MCFSTLFAQDNFEEYFKLIDKENR
ncbi:transformation system protein, partial [Campylobacter jejuni]|nr:transformation system protein [Campylobacter jejuni]